MEFFGTYLEVTPYSRLVWTNEEGDDGKTVTTVTFDENAGKTLLVVHDAIPRRKRLTPDRPAQCPRRSINSTSFSPAWDPYHNKMTRSIARSAQRMSTEFGGFTPPGQDLERGI